MDATGRRKTIACWFSLGTLLVEQIAQMGRLFLAWRTACCATARRRRCLPAGTAAGVEHRDRLLDAAALRAWLCKVVVNESLRNQPPGKLERNTLAGGELPGTNLGQSPHHDVDLRDSVAAALDKLPDHLRKWWCSG